MGILKTVTVAFIGMAVIGAVFGKDKDNIAQSTVKVNSLSTVEVETEQHRACRLELHRENPYGGTYNGQPVLVWDTPAFGTYDDGDVWVGYNRKVGDKVFYDMVKICG